MNNKKKLLLSGLLAFALCIGLASTLAYFTDNKTQENTITMGNVEIELTEPEFSKNQGNHFLNALPNEPITKDPTITVAATSADAYVRLNLSYAGLSDAQIVELKTNIQLNAGWIIVDDYIYFKDVVSANDVVVAFDKVVVPNWGNDMKGKEFNLNVKAEAVQADYFTPTKDANGFIIEWPGVTF